VFNAMYVERQASHAAHGPGRCATPPRRCSDSAAARRTRPGQRSPPPPSPEALRAALPEGDPLAPLVRALESGDSIIIFPEGTRGHGDEPQPFKSGLFKLAQMFPQVVLVPAWINNVQRVMPKGEVVPVPILCSVTFGAPRPFHRARRAVMPGEERRPESFATARAAPSWPFARRPRGRH
jgi:1-acyl-sn-glycerol-3-phosphate acyltransferase